MSDFDRVPRLLPKGQAHPAGSLAAALAGQAGADLSAPAHPFDPALGSGIVWSPDALELWLGGARRDVAEVATATPADCWRELAFVDAFPTVTHWWFGSLWTQRVRATQQARRADGSVMVWLQAVQDDADELPWVVAVDGTASGPLPDYAGGPRNVPLQLALAQVARLVQLGQMAINSWAVVTSLVAAPELARVLGGDRRTALLRALDLA